MGDFAAAKATKGRMSESRSTSLRRATAWQEKKRQEILRRCISAGYPKPTEIVKHGFLLGAHRWASIEFRRRYSEWKKLARSSTFRSIFMPSAAGVSIGSKPLSNSTRRLPIPLTGPRRFGFRRTNNSCCRLMRKSNYEFGVSIFVKACERLIKKVNGNF